MWRLRIGANARNDTHLFTTNNYIGRQIWEFDANAGSPEELAEVDEARRNFSDNKSRFKANADLLWRMQFLREKKFKQKIPLVRVDEAEKIKYEDAKTALRRGLLYFTALQADDGHWPAENSGSLFFHAPFFICLYITGHLEKIFTLEHRIELLRYLYNHQADKIATLVKTACVEIEVYWPMLFARMAEKRNVADFIMNVWCRRRWSSFCR